MPNLPSHQLLAISTSGLTTASINTINGLGRPIDGLHHSLTHGSGMTTIMVVIVCLMKMPLHCHVRIYSTLCGYDFHCRDMLSPWHPKVHWLLSGSCLHELLLADIIRRVEHTLLIQHCISPIKGCPN